MTSRHPRPLTSTCVASGRECRGRPSSSRISSCVSESVSTSYVGGERSRVEEEEDGRCARGDVLLVRVSTQLQQIGHGPSPLCISPTCPEGNLEARHAHPSKLPPSKLPRFRCQPVSQSTHNTTLLVAPSTEQLRRKSAKKDRTGTAQLFSPSFVRSFVFESVRILLYNFP